MALAALIAAAPAHASFTPEGGPYTVGTNPYGIVAADFNGDGGPDLAVINGTSSNLSVLLRQPGGFAQEAGSPFAVGSGPDFGSVADFNGDGRPDVAVAAFATAGLTVSVMLRQAAGGFALDPNSPSTAGGRASSVVAADFNGDGLTDLAVPNWDSAQFVTFLRQPNGTYAQEGPAIAVGANPRNLVAADFNGDGLPDLAITNQGGGTVSVLLRQAAGGFAQEGLPIAVGTQPSGIVASDVNGDGRPDLAVTNSGSGTVSVLLRQAAGGFAAEGSPITVGAVPLGVAAGDFNGDGRPDLAVTSNSDGNVTVLLRQAAGGYAPDAGSPIALPRAYGVAVADFNADQRPDLAVGSDLANTVTILLNTTAATPAPLPLPAPPAPPVPGKSVVVRVVSGTVYVRYPSGYKPRAAGPAKGFTPFTGAANVPVGTQFDTEQGRVNLTSAADTAGKKTQASDFYDGIFQVKQSVPKKKPKKAVALTTDIVLKGQLSRSQCAPLKGARSAATDKKKGPKGVLGKLWGSGKGKFRTTGKYSSATVRGTIWLTQDECDGTLTKVKRGTVRVRDLKRKKTVTVKAGHSYLARAQRAATKGRR
jgi:FG-GAP-like repeat/FG-GAP repeat